MPTFMMRFEKEGADFVAVIDGAQPPCREPGCGAPPNSFEIFFLVSEGARNDYRRAAESGVPLAAEVVCPREHVVYAGPTRIRYWSEVERPEDREDRDTGEIRKIYTAISTTGRLALPYPRTSLLERDFLPGRMASPDVWVAERAKVAPGATLRAPLLVGARAVVEDGAVCGPHAIVVDSIVKSGQTLESCFVHENRVLATPEDAHSRWLVEEMQRRIRDP